MTAVISADPADTDMADRQNEATADTLAMVPSLVEKEGEYDVELNARLAQCESIMGSQKRYIRELEVGREALIDQADEAIMLKAELEAVRGELTERTAMLTAIQQMVRCVR